LPSSVITPCQESQSPSSLLPSYHSKGRAFRSVGHSRHHGRALTLLPCHGSLLPHDAPGVSFFSSCAAAPGADSYLKSREAVRAIEGARILLLTDQGLLAGPTVAVRLLRHTGPVVLGNSAGMGVTRPHGGGICLLPLPAHSASLRTILLLQSGSLPCAESGPARVPPTAFLSIKRGMRFDILAPPVIQ